MMLYKAQQASQPQQPMYNPNMHPQYGYPNYGYAPQGYYPPPPPQSGYYPQSPFYQQPPPMYGSQGPMYSQPMYNSNGYNPNPMQNSQGYTNPYNNPYNNNPYNNKNNPKNPYGQFWFYLALILIQCTIFYSIVSYIHTISHNIMIMIVWFCRNEFEFRLCLQCTQLRPILKYYHDRRLMWWSGVIWISTILTPC